MLTSTQITAGASRLTNGRLTATDIDSLVSIFRLFFADLEEKKGYEFESKLTQLDDTGNTKQQAAQVGACLNKLEELGFGVSSLQGGRDALYYREKDEYWQYVAIAFSKLYPLPSEFAGYELKRREFTPRYSSTIRTLRRYR